MTNAEAAQHFASLPPAGDAEVLVVNGCSGSAERFVIEPPGTNLEDIDSDALTENDEKLVTIFMKW